MLEFIRRWRGRVFLWVGLPVIAVLGLAFVGPDVLPAWQAERGAGTAGTFTAVDHHCGRRSCTWSGDFAPAGGGAVRRDVLLYDAPSGLAVGGTAPARDTGASRGVFCTDGGETFLLITGMALAAALAGVGWVLLVLRTIRRRRGRALGDRWVRTPAPG
ncbi:hypothetical protein [Micromonospora auratinigra]|uniref:Uncharacterized protein n=1 Tax=Micromonospora auratinigra TaxID=261654 RepID=A0A1A9A3E8_9ACTN|nr:hypothetical protein [Micromonospora auratinigra]SBT50718.1 hypothetical protein GA0070611_4868 [Micromonospora auratinigra]